jgi:hypothetical protein
VQQGRAAPCNPPRKIPSHHVQGSLAITIACGFALLAAPAKSIRIDYTTDLFNPLPRNGCEFIGTVQRKVFSARHAGLWSGGMGTVSDDIWCCELLDEDQEGGAAVVA